MGYCGEVVWCGFFLFSKSEEAVGCCGEEVWCEVLFVLHFFVYSSVFVVSLPVAKFE